MRWRGLRFECLERRLLLAGDVTWSLKSGSLVVTGDLDPAGNQIELRHLGGNQYRLSGLTDTSLKNSLNLDNPVIIDGVTKSITIDMKSGPNSVTLNGTAGFVVPTDLTIKSGENDDSVVIENGSIGGKLTIDTAAGNDTIGLSGGSVAKDASIKTGTEDDSLTITNVEFSGKLTIDTGTVMTTCLSTPPR
jgi:hypothetical protein